MSSRAIVPGQNHTLLRFWRDTHDVDRLPVIAFMVDDDDATIGPPDALAATGDRLYQDSSAIFTATLLPDGRVVDAGSEFDSQAIWVETCKRLSNHQRKAAP